MRRGRRDAIRGREESDEGGAIRTTVGVLSWVKGEGKRRHVRAAHLSIIGTHRIYTF